MFATLFNLLPLLGAQLLMMLATKATIPASDQPAVLADANGRLPVGEAAITQAQLVAMDAAVIDYVAGRIERQVTPRV